MDSNCANIFHVLMSKSLYLINETHVGENSRNLNILHPLHYPPMNIKTQYVPCTLHLILPSMTTQYTKAKTSMDVLETIERRHLDPNYIFMELSDHDIIPSEKDFQFLLRLYTMTSTYILFDTARTKVFCMDCGSLSENNYISIRKDADHISLLDSLFRPPDFYGLAVGTNLEETTFYKNQIESPNNIFPIPPTHSTVNLLSKHLNFSIHHLSYRNVPERIEHCHLGNGIIRRVTNPTSVRFTVSSGAIVTDEFHLTVFTLTRLTLYTVLLPFDDASWSILSIIVLVTITFIIVNNHHNYKSTQVVMLWMLRNIFEQDDTTTTKQACGSKTITKFIAILWILCSMFIGWSYKGCVSSEMSIKFPGSTPNSLQEILDMNMTIITTVGVHSSSNVKRKTIFSHLHNQIADLLNQQHDVNYSPQYLTFLSLLSNEVQFFDLVSYEWEFGCSITQKLTRFKNNSNVHDSWSVFSSKEHTNWVTALMKACSNFTSIKIPSNSNKFPGTFAWVGPLSTFFKIFSNKLSHVAQSGIYCYWEKDYMRKVEVTMWEIFILNINRNSTNDLMKGKAVQRKIIAGVARYQQVYELNPITLANVYMPLVVFGGLCCICNIVFMIEALREHFFKSNNNITFFDNWMKLKCLIEKQLKIVINFKMTRPKLMMRILEDRNYRKCTPGTAKLVYVKRAK